MNFTVKVAWHLDGQENQIQLTPISAPSYPGRRSNKKWML